MKNAYLPGILFFSACWGLVERLFGPWLIDHNIPLPSVCLTVIALALLAAARVYYPRFGLATLIAAAATLFKYLHTGSYPGPMVGILLTGIAFDVVFQAVQSQSLAPKAALTAYADALALALVMTFLFRDPSWTRGGLDKFVSHLGLGSIAAVAAALLVPVVSKITEKIQTRLPAPFAFQPQFVNGLVLLATAALWGFSVFEYCRLKF